MKDSNEEKSNFAEAVELACTNWVNGILEEMTGHTAFLCGDIMNSFKSISFSTFKSVVKSIVEDNKINKIYFCNRNDFDRFFYTQYLLILPKILK